MVTVAFSMLSLATKVHTSGSLWCTTKILRYRCHKDAGMSNRQFFCGVRRTDISANNRYTDGTNCAPLPADLFIPVWGGLCTKSPQSRQETLCPPIQLHLQIYRLCIVSEKHKICRVFGIHLSTWTWNKGNNGNCSLLLIFELLSLHWQWKA